MATTIMELEVEIARALNAVNEILDGLNDLEEPSFGLIDEKIPLRLIRAQAVLEEALWLAGHVGIVSRVRVDA